MSRAGLNDLKMDMLKNEGCAGIRRARHQVFKTCCVAGVANLSVVFVPCDCLAAIVRVICLDLLPFGFGDVIHGDSLSALVTSGAGWWLLRIQPRGRKLEGLGDGGIPSGWAVAGDCLADCGRGSLSAKAGVSISPRLQKVARVFALVVLPDGDAIAPELLLLSPILPALGIKLGCAALRLHH